MHKPCRSSEGKEIMKCLERLRYLKLFHLERAGRVRPVIYLVPNDRSFHRHLARAQIINAEGDRGWIWIKASSHDVAFCPVSISFRLLCIKGDELRDARCWVFLFP
ncbi:hypothetical protein L345_09455, partial [Ophiophagus hannah]